MGARLKLGARWFGQGWEHRPHDYGLAAPGDAPIPWLELGYVGREVMILRSKVDLPPPPVTTRI